MSSAASAIAIKQPNKRYTHTYIHTRERARENMLDRAREIGTRERGEKDDAVHVRVGERCQHMYVRIDI